jgi:hypothetical protein
MKKLAFLFLFAFNVLFLAGGAQAYHFNLTSTDYTSSAYAQMLDTIVNNSGSLSAYAKVSKDFVIPPNGTQILEVTANITPANTPNQINFSSKVKGTQETQFGPIHYQTVMSAQTDVTYNFVVIADPGESSTLSGSLIFSKDLEEFSNMPPQLFAYANLNGSTFYEDPPSTISLTAGATNILSVHMGVYPPIYTSSNPHYFDGEYSLTLTVPASPAPLPASLLLLGSGCLGLAGWQRLRKS